MRRLFKNRSPSPPLETLMHQCGEHSPGICIFNQHLKVTPVLWIQVVVYNMSFCKALELETYLCDLEQVT